MNSRTLSRFFKLNLKRTPIKNRAHACSKKREVKENFLKLELRILKIQKKKN